MMAPTGILTVFQEIKRSAKRIFNKKAYVVVGFQTSKDNNPGKCKFFSSFVFVEFSLTLLACHAPKTTFNFLSSIEDK